VKSPLTVALNRLLLGLRLKLLRLLFCLRLGLLLLRLLGGLV
jgi:hypothetical protein